MTDHIQQAATVIHDALCSECSDEPGTGLTIRSRDADQAARALAAAGLLSSDFELIAQANRLRDELEKRDDTITVLRSKLTDARLRLDAIESPAPAAPRVPQPGDRVPTEDEQRAGKTWAVQHPDYTLIPQTENPARWTQSKIPGSVLVHWDGSAWVEVTEVRPADTGKETDR